MIHTSDLFRCLDATLARPLFEQTEDPWTVLPKLKEFIRTLGPTLDPAEYDSPSPEVWIHKSCKVYPFSTVLGPSIIGARTEIRPGAFVRGSVLVGADCVIGNSTELKNCILFDHVQVPHFNYVGDSVFGTYAHTGAGTICSNFKSDQSAVSLHCNGETIETGFRKLGAILGDHVEVGCNSVLCPGTVIGPDTVIYPLCRVRGCVPSGSIMKDSGSTSIVGVGQ